jgi:hypothetical protein
MHDKQTRRKLKISRETLRTLIGADLDKAVGGNAINTTGSQCCELTTDPNYPDCQKR